MAARLEHVNIAVRDPRATAAVLQELFGWHVRWEGDPAGLGFSMHVGTDDHYVALYRPAHAMTGEAMRYKQWSGLNHIGVVVDDIDAAEARVRAAGYTPGNHADYEPGRRFYFTGPDEVEYEVVSYD